MTLCLDFHAAYRCRHSGACCRAGWTIPFDARERHAAEAVRPRRGAFHYAPDNTAIALREADGSCSFFDGAGHRCTIHEAGGHLALPVSCRMFPRIVLIDARGTFVSLSHFCPTAAALLFEGPARAAAIVDAPAALGDVGALDGLDARGAWPPLLRPGVMTDLDSYAAWERLGIALITREGQTADACLDSLAAATTRIAGWSPTSARTLMQTVEDAFAMQERQTMSIAVHEIGVKRWLAARLFGNWIAYQGDGLQAIVRYLRGCLTTFQLELAHDGSPLEAIRRSDLAIVHRA